MNNPASPVAAGGSTTLTADGFDPGAQIAIYLYPNRVSLGVFVTGSDGSLTARLTIPVTTTAGQHAVVLASGGVDEAEGYIQVTPAVQTATSPSTAPASSAAPSLAATGGPTGQLLLLALALLGLGALALAASHRSRLAR